MLQKLSKQLTYHKANLVATKRIPLCGKRAIIVGKGLNKSDKLIAVKLIVSSTSKP